MTAEELIAELAHGDLGSDVEDAIRRALLDWCIVLDRVEGFEHAIAGCYLGVLDTLGKAVEKASDSDPGK